MYSLEIEIDNCDAEVAAAVLVKVDATDQVVHLMPIEAERLMGMPEQCTFRHSYASEVDRMRCIGNGWVEP